MPDRELTASGRVLEIERKTRRLYSRYKGRHNVPLLETLMKERVIPTLPPKEKKTKKGDAAPSRQGVNIGRKPQPFDFRAIAAFQISNPHHAACILAKSAATTGLGFVDEEKVDDLLDPFCHISFQDVMSAVTEDFWQTGNGYIEVVRDENDEKIVGLHHVPSHEVGIVIEDIHYNMHYEVLTGEGIGNIRFAEFGDLEDFKARIKDGLVQSMGLGQSDPLRCGELIHFRRSSSLNRWYGFPDWLAAVAAIELDQAAHQQLFDFFANGGVPDVVVSVLGAKVDEADWALIKKTFQSSVGPTNAHKNVLLNLHQPGVVVQIDKLALEGKTDGGAFSGIVDTTSLEIVSAHRVPPLLAGIQIPGKLGANNELPNALIAFQAKVIGPAQKCFTGTLTATLGNKLFNGGLGLTREDFKFNKITEVMATPLATTRNTQLGVTGDEGSNPNVEGSGQDPTANGSTSPAAGPINPSMKSLDTLGRMREPLPQAQAKGRDLKRGVKKIG